MTVVAIDPVSTSNTGSFKCRANNYLFIFKFKEGIYNKDKVVRRWSRGMTWAFQAHSPGSNPGRRILKPKCIFNPSQFHTCRLIARGISFRVRE